MILRLLATAALLLLVVLAAAACTVAPIEPMAGHEPPPTVAPPGQPLPEPAGDAMHIPSRWAFVRDDALYIHVDGQEIQIEDCRERRCDVYFPSWSPGGEHLLYYIAEYSPEASTHSIRVANLRGKTITLTNQAAYIRPPAWSPDGAQVVYLRATGRHRDGSEDSPLGLEEIFEVWTVEIEHEGAFEDADMPQELLGEIGFGVGCGGGGRSESAVVYEREGGFAYGYLAGVVVWSADDILLYSNNCGSRGVGRFDMRQGVQLEPYAESLGSLSMNPQRTEWVAATHDGRLLRGAAGSLAVQQLDNQEKAELVFWGAATHAIYYTTLHTNYGDDLIEEVAALGEDVWISPYFDFGQASIRRYSLQTGRDEIVWSDDSYAYARIQEPAAGLLVFSAVESGRRLFEGLQTAAVSAGTLADYLPSVHVYLLQEGAGQPAKILENAGISAAWR